MKLAILMEITPALQVLNATKIPATAGYRVGKALRKVEPEVRAFEEQRMKLAQELGTLNPVKNVYEFEGENSKSFHTQLAALLDEEVEVNIPKLAIADLGNAYIEPVHLATLDGVVLFETLKLSAS